jgi:AraC-like DNA-binding protein/ligand-binding sensor protein
MSKDINIMLIDFLNFITKTMNIQITIKDTIGFMPIIDKSLSMALIPFLLHTNPYCKYIKSHKQTCDKCSSMSVPIHRKCKEVTSTFFGICHAGVGEYIIPIESKLSGVIGFITVGSYKVTNTKAINRIKGVCDISALDYSIAFFEYSSLKEIQYDCNIIISALAPLSYLIGTAYEENKQQPSKASIHNYNPKEDSILLTILDLIQNKYHEALNVSKLSKLCFCSESCINHIFKKKTGVTIKSYINCLRIEEAKLILKETDKSITEIAEYVGFNNSSYFTKVFTDFVKISPTEYRQL